MPLPLDYRYLFEHAGDGMVVLDASLEFVQVNAAFAAIVGRAPEELVGRSVVQLIHPDDLLANPVRTAEVEREGSAVSMRRLVRADGTVVRTEVVATRLPDGGMLCAVRVTGQYDEEAAVRETEARFHAVAENLNAGLVVTDLQNRAVYVNSYMCQRTSYAREELIGKNLAKIFFTKREAALDAVRLRRRTAGVREMYEVEHRCKDGTSFMGEISAAPLHDGTGRIIGTVGVVIDVTERDEWARETAEREQRYRMLFEVMPLPAWVYDVETFRFLAVNPAAIAHYGYSEDEFVAMTILDIRPPDDVEPVRAEVIARRGGARERAHERLYRHLKADGTLIDVQVNSHQFRFEGRAARIVVVNDVTEQQRLRALEREMTSQLLQAQKMEAVGRLAGGVAHDFNNLLSVVLHAASALEEALPATDALRDEVSDIRQAAERGAALTRQLLAFGRKEAHAPAPIDVHEVIANVERLLARALGGGVRLEVRRGSSSARTVADAIQLEQVLVNLAINARDAMPDGGVVVITTGERELEAAEAQSLDVAPGRYVTIVVADSGIGMDERTRAHAFEPFFTTKGPQQGTGLGLATVYGIVRQSHGAVTLASAPAAGTQVTIYLPRDRGPQSPPAGLMQQDGAEVRASGGSGRVLLVDDEPRVRAQAKRLLERCGYVVCEAANGAEGEREFKACAAEGGVDVVVTDVVMPAVGGVEMVARIRALAPDVAVVFVSGFTAEDRDLPLDARTAFVPKPYTIASLRDAIAMVVAG